MPSVRWKDSSRRRALAPTGFTAAASRRVSRATGRAARTAGVPVSVISPSDSKAGMAAFENGPSWMTMRLMSGATAPRSVSTGVISLLSAPSRTIVGRSSRRKRGQPLDVGLQRVAALGGRLGDLAGVLDRAADVRALARQRLEDRVRVARQVGDHLVLLGEDLQDLVDLLQRRVGAADDHAQVLAAAGDADARGPRG